MKLSFLRKERIPSWHRTAVLKRGQRGLLPAEAASAANFCHYITACAYFASVSSAASAATASTAFFRSADTLMPSAPTTMLLQVSNGISTLRARLWPTARAIAGVISPSIASAITMPTGPTMTSAVRQATITAFSPVLPPHPPPPCAARQPPWRLCPQPSPVRRAGVRECRSQAMRLPCRPGRLSQEPA